MQGLNLNHSDEHRRAQNRTREEEGNLVAKKTPMAKVEKRQQQEEDAAKKLKAAEAEYRAKIEVANQKQLKIKDETSNTAKELQVCIVLENFHQFCKTCKK